MTTPEPRVADTPAAFTPEWVEAALRHGGLDARVDAVRAVERVGTGQMASCYRLELIGEGAPPTVVAKVAAPDATEMAANGYRNELRFYELVAPHATGRLARCHYAAMDGTRFVLLLEDLAPAAQGDQVAGCSTDDVVLALENLADLHGSLWEHAVLDEFAPLVEAGPQGDEMFAGFMRWGTDEFVARYADRLAHDDIAVLRGFTDRVAGFRNNRRPPRTIVHGDYRLDNLLYRPSPRECIIVDWQTAGAGPAGHDLAYCIATSLAPDARRASERALIDRYAERLRVHGVERTDAELWDDYRFGFGQGITVTVLGAVVATRTERGDDMFMAMASRICAAMRDHGSLDLYA
jgi:aminoglycoside/choline kinase family phosphotransferase